MKVYTKTGDQGTTSLVGGERVSKTDLRVEAYGTVDELTAFTALLTDLIRSEAGVETYVQDLHRIESKLVKGIEPSAIEFLEHRIDAMQAIVPQITKFTIPGGNKAVSMCHVCRTVCRRAERAALRASEIQPVAPETLAYLNRLSDYFYLLGRALTEHLHVKEELWIP